MSEEQVDVVWNEYWGGSDQARSELIEHYYPLAQYAGHKMARDLHYTVEPDDMI